LFRLFYEANRRPRLAALPENRPRRNQSRSCSGSGLTANRINQSNASGLYPAFNRGSCSPRPALSYRPLLQGNAYFYVISAVYSAMRVGPTNKVRTNTAVLRIPVGPHTLFLTTKHDNCIVAVNTPVTIWSTHTLLALGCRNSPGSRLLQVAHYILYAVRMHKHSLKVGNI
jgi:hypothetical protein